jgi:P27 family predicted phage terminase small subunit
MAGRPPKPSALKHIEGNRGKRAINSREPEPALLDDLAPPAHLAPAVADVWRELAPKLRRAQLLTELDTPLLEITATAIAMFRLATGKIDGDKLMARNAESGAISLSPWVLLQSMAHKQAMNTLREWGATPAARSRVVIDPQADLFDKPGAQTGAARFFDRQTTH